MSLFKPGLKKIPQIFCIIFLLLSHAQLFAQQQAVVKGQVNDDDNTPLVGVTVVAINSQTKVATGTKTDSSGMFQFSNLTLGGSYSFEVSYVGFESQTLTGYTLKANANVSLLISLKPVERELDQVVAIGYGTVKKTDLTGAVSTVRMQDLQNIPLTRVDQMLAGRIAGAEFMSTDGTPGSGTTVRIRGTRSISASNEPLYVVDGVMDGINNLNDLNPSDIASISVLKDASATAIYGSRGANGVIIITTKGGVDRGGKADFNFKVSRGFAEMPGYLDLMNATEFAQLLNDRFYLTSTANQTKPLEDYPYPDPLALGEGTDWQKRSPEERLFQVIY
ncbi:TonB-dependent receptor plug domain-containing protein [Niabella hibiscisoli]|uniref:TonB-dependent receptor plug domain-containing protein n=1 Tax=Niabella hibiscisoli TaxID=1825928 RepID=UPI001F1170F6|nr:TonB-dependent receptor plug domain-containing protein [Niabella hibiscisoli]MCH5717911.1 TonB-dependent receptor plug domain-containing protein [Niabella hibiscisoli]